MKFRQDTLIPVRIFFPQPELQIQGTGFDYFRWQCQPQWNIFGDTGLKFLAIQNCIIVKDLKNSSKRHWEIELQEQMQ